MAADECEFCHLGYCCPPEYLVKAGFVCPDALPMEEGDITNKCGGSNDKLMTEEEWDEEQERMIDRMRTARDDREMKGYQR